MKKQILLSSIYVFAVLIPSHLYAQKENIEVVNNPSLSILQSLFVAAPNHRELAIKSLELAVAAGFSDTIDITIQEIKDRLEAGAYSEDFELIPGTIDEHFPNPWTQGPDFDFFGYYPFSKIPYGSYRETLSGWYRGLNHGYDPVQEFKWPGAFVKTFEWANSPMNSFIWDNVVSLYNSGNKAEAYQCLGHILHLLADLSIPSHVKIVNHGMDVVELNQGKPWDPDKLELIVDEYELAISGGIILPTLINIPDVLNEFRDALDLVDPSNIPEFSSWEEYLIEIGKFTYNHPTVNQFYVAPDQNGGWGVTLNENGTIIFPTIYATLPLVEINNEWFELKIKSTANSNGTIIPETKLIEMCNELVPKAVEYGAGLILHFYKMVTEIESEKMPLEYFLLNQNYPNPFNPSTKISWQVPVGSWQTLKIYDVLGNEVATLADEYKPAGSYEVEWNATGFPSGVYFYQLKTDKYINTKKMILIK